MGSVRSGWLGLGIAGAWLWCSLAVAAGPLDKLLTMQRVEADPQKNYALTEKNGPWMISACSFSGDDAERQARELVLELRKRYKLPAYVYSKKFDLGKDTFGAGIDRYGNPQKMKYARGSQLEEVAVLVGDYPTIDDPDAQETRDKLKYYEPDCLKLEPNKKTARNLAALRWIQKEILPAGNENKKKGPMGQAFITTNPLLPKEYFAPSGLDDLTIKANEGVPHSLLDCRGKYSVQIAHFSGKVVIKPQEIKEIETGQKQMESHLRQAAAMAHALTEGLRTKGYEAYEFHDRYSSIVTVGSFDWVQRTAPDGREEVNPAVREVIDRFRGGKMVGNQLELRTIGGIPLDPQPMPIIVPRRSIGGTYARDAVNTR